MTGNRCWQTFSMKGQMGSILGFEGQVGFCGNSAGKESACNAGDPGFIPGSGRSPGEGRGDLLQHSWASLLAQLVKNLPAVWETWVWSLCWEDPMEKGTATHASILAWIVHGVAKSRTRLSDFNFSLDLRLNYTALPLRPQSSHEWYENEWAGLFSNKTLFRDTEIWISFNFHMSQNVLLIFFFKL